MTLTKDEAALVIRCLRERVKSISDLIRDHGHRIPPEAIEVLFRDQEEARRLAQQLAVVATCE
jgi:hypothetical protein